MPSKTFSGVGKVGGDAGENTPNGIPFIACSSHEHMRSLRGRVLKVSYSDAVRKGAHAMEHGNAVDAKRGLSEVHVAIPC